MRKRLPGYLTLEFALLLPALMLVYMALAEAAFLLYDRCLLQENAELLLIQTARDWEEGFLEGERFQNRAAGIADYKYLFLQQTEAECEISGASMTVTVRGRLYNVFHALGLGEEYWELEGQASRTLLNRTELLRMIKRIKSAAEEE